MMGEDRQRLSCSAVAVLSFSGVRQTFTYGGYQESRSVHHIFMLDKLLLCGYLYFLWSFPLLVKKVLIIKKKGVGSNCSHLKFHIPFRM